MEKTVRAIGICRWLGLPLGGIMFFFTYGSFGITIASVLSIMINEAGNVESYIEIKRLKSGIIARVYLINAREKVAVVHKAIARRLERCTFKKYLWIMQLTDMPGKSALRDTQRMLNDQLLEELMRKRRGDGN